MTFTTYADASSYCFSANMKFGIGSYMTRKIYAGWIVEAQFGSLPAIPMPR
jgi:hypothetical protein